MRRPGIARRTGPRASPAPQGIPLAKFRPSVDKSTVVRSKRTSQCRDVLFETKMMAPTWAKQAVAAAAAWLPRSRRTCRAAWVAERTSRASSDGGRRPRAPLRPPMQLRARTTIYEDFSKQPARSSSRPRAGWEPAPVAHGLRAGSARPVPWLSGGVDDTCGVGNWCRPHVLAHTAFAWMRAWRACMSMRVGRAPAGSCPRWLRSTPATRPPAAYLHVRSMACPVFVAYSVSFLSCVRVGVVRCGLVTPASYETLGICCPYLSDVYKSFT
jgi:hypothetical protein